LKLHEDLLIEDCFKIINDIAWEETCGKNPKYGVEAQRLSRKKAEILDATLGRWEGE
jgi:hypothetical protein